MYNYFNQYFFAKLCGMFPEWVCDFTGICIRIGRVNEMLIARFENPLTHKIERSQSKILSTKINPENHGYGLQSIEMIVSKYGGEMDVKTDDGAFTLTVIIPA